MERSVPVGFAAGLYASCLFGCAIIPSRGGYSDQAMTMVLLASIVIGWRYVAAFKPGRDQVPAKVVAPLAWVLAMAMALFAYCGGQELLYPARAWELGHLAQGGLLLGLAAYLPGFVPRAPDPRWLRQLRFAFVALCVAAAGVDTYRASPAPAIDVWTVQQQGAEALAQGKNPYQVVAQGDTGPREAADVPYVYPPMQLYATLPAWLAFKETRYTMLAATLLLGLLLRAIVSRLGGRTLPAILEDGPALFVWCTPKLYFILEQGWVDPVQLAWCAALVAAAVWRKPMLMAVLAGCVLGAKQTMFLFVGLFGLSLRFTWRQWATVGAVALASYLPWVLWDFRAVKRANFDFLAALPLRADALTYITWVKHKTGLNVPPALAFPAAFALSGLAAWKLPRGLAPVTLATVAAVTAFFTLNKWAFANYYFTLLGLSALAAAAAFDDPVQTAPAPGQGSLTEADAPTTRLA
jgi:hypothetical protein